MRNILKDLRKNKQITQEQLAIQLKVTRQTINAIENNKYSPTLELALNIAKFLDKPVEEIFYNDN